MVLITQANLMNKTADAIVSDQATDLSVADPIIPEEKDRPEILDTIGAAFNQENIIASFVAKKKSGTVLFDSFREVSNDFDPLDNIEGYEMHAKDFIYLQDQDEVEARKTFIDKQISDRQLLAESSGWISYPAMFGAGVLDPTMLIPGGAAIKAARVGTRILKGAGAGGALVGAAVSIQEAALHSTQTERTAEETMYNIAGAAALGGILGGAIPLVKSAVRNFHTKELVDIQKGVEQKLEIKEDGSVGAAQVKGAVQATAKEEGIARINEAALKKISILNPTIRGLTSPIVTTRKLTNRLFNHNFILNKNISGEASEVSMEAAIKIDRARTTNLLNDIEDIYIRSKKDTATEKLTLTQFSNKVGMAMRRGDVSENPHVQRAAQKLRKEWDKSVKRMQELELIAKELDTKTATSYFSRVYDQKLITRNSAKFLDITKNYFRRVNKKLDESEIAELAASVKANILGVGDGLGRINLKKAGAKPSFTKGRVFLIPDEEIEEFLISDAMKITQTYLGQASDTIRFTEMLDSMGVKNLSELAESMRSDLRALDKGATPAQQAKNAAAFEKDLKLIDDMTKLFFGREEQFGGPALRTLRKFQVLTKLGGVTLSSLPDIAMPVFVHGIPRTMRDGWGAMFRDFKTSKIAKDELKDFGVGLEMEQNDILRSMIDPDFRNSLQAGPIEHGADVAVNAFSRLSLMARWNNFGKRMSGQISMARTIRGIKAEAAGKISPNEATRLRRLGLSKEDAAIALKEFKRYGEETGGSFIANFKNWDDARVKDIFGAGVLKDVDATILTPGRGDLPIVAQTNELAKTIFQFKSFMFAASNKVVLSGLQRRDAAALQGTIGLIVMGMFTLKIKDFFAGREKDYTNSELISEGIERSGVSGMLSIPSAIFNPWSSSSRFASAGAEGVLLGPGLKNATESIGLYHKVVGDEDMTNADKRKLLRLVPYSNLFYLQLMLQKAFGIADDDD